MSHDWIDIEYIKMCDCSEIQDSWYKYRRQGDMIVYREKLYLLKSHGGGYEFWKLGGNSGFITNYIAYKNAYGIIWLPYQDQMQKMAGYDIQAELIVAFYKFAFLDAWCGKLDSMEKLWLVFVMYKKSKVWDAEKQKWRYT